ncbi:MAG: hypothetical protein C4523_11505 [Myxococcales bacterium]|nr:MAG: hypothetical protein C4523_11505 [Myxococcales bacterium]
MRNFKRYASYEDFEREEYMRVKSFYENLEDIMDEELFSHCDDPFDFDEKKADKADQLKEIEL